MVTSVTMSGEGAPRPYRRALDSPALSLAELRTGPGLKPWIRTGLVEVVEGASASIRAALAVLGGARADLLFVDGGTHAGRLPTGMVRDARARGVGVRRVCSRAELTAAERAGRDAAAGGEVRVLDVVPTTFAIVDAEVAVTPLTVAGEGQVTGLLVVGQCALFDTAMALADLLWERAQPYTTWRAHTLQTAGPVPARPPRLITDTGGEPGAAGSGGPGASGSAGMPSPSDRQLLALLTQGLKDRAIARQLGIGERTVQRRLNRLMSELGAQTRFQAALNAVRRGWL